LYNTGVLYRGRNGDVNVENNVEKDDGEELLS
jgi:hypothetical protein